MNLNYLISAKAGYFQIELKGTIAKEDVTEAVRNLLQTSGYYHGAPVIWVTTEADLSNIDLDTINQAVKEIDSMLEGLTIGLIALVTEKSINASIVMLFKEIYNKNVVSVFDSLERAEKWILSKKLA